MGKLNLFFGRRVTSLLLSIMVIAFSNLPVSASDEDLGAKININWSTSNMFLNSENSIEQEITFTDIEGSADGVNDYHRFHMFFCWKILPTFSLSNVRNPCGFVGIAPSTNGKRLTRATFDLTLWDGLDFSISNDSQNCAKTGPMAKVGDIQTHYVVCWRSVTVSANTPYLLRVREVRSPANKGENWWAASLTNLRTEESVTVGQIKSLNLDTNAQLEDLQNVYFYRGNNRVACNAIPIGDLRLSPIRNTSAKNSSYVSTVRDRCIEASVFPTRNPSGNLRVLFGGANPGSRDPESNSGANPQPSGSPSASPNPGQSSTRPIQESKEPPVKPALTGVNIVGNKLNINVNLGSSSSNRAERVYLIAPLLGITAANPLIGTVFGNFAAWSIPLERALAGTQIPFEILGEKDGIMSDPLSSNYQTPSRFNPIVAEEVPSPPKNFKSRIVGSSAVVTVDSTLKAGALATDVLLFSQSLGISKKKAIKGDLVGERALIEVPVRASMAGKKYPVTVFFINEKGESKPLNATLSIPGAPRFSAPPVLLPPKVVETTICARGNQTRTFGGSSCPPGWSKK